MPWNLLRTFLPGIGAGALILLHAVPVRGETRPQLPITLPTDPDLSRKLDAAHDYARAESWAKTTRILQTILDAREDAFVEVKREGDDDNVAVHLTSVRAEAERVLGALPAKAREFYELTYGPPARALLEEARAREDPELLARTAQRYLHTQAGTEALILLGTYYLDRGRSLPAAACFGRLIGSARATELSAQTLFRAAIAFQRAGDKANAEQAWKRLAARAADGLRLGGRVISLEELKTAANMPEPEALAPSGSRDWTLFRGAPGRCSQGSGGMPLLESSWQQPTIYQSCTENWIAMALQQQENLGRPILPPAAPVTVGDKVIYRSCRGIEAVDRASGKPLWFSEMEWGFDSMVLDSNHYFHLSEWAGAYMRESPHMLYENSAVGTLSTDGARVYAVDDLAVAPSLNPYQDPQLSFAPYLSDAQLHNRLVAIDVESGRALWELGAKGGGEADPFQNSFFLGPPLPLGGRLYALVERDRDVRLVCLDPARGDVLWTQKLATADNKLLQDPGRRMHAAPLAYADGVLVCPTNAGAVVGVDVIFHGLLWGFVYAEEPPPLPPLPQVRRRRGQVMMPQPPPPPLHADWKLAAPILQDGKVVFTAPDSPAIHCLNLRDGSLVWKSKRAEDDIYCAGVYQDRVLLVGKQACRALDLAGGEQLWKLETGVPSGEGAAAGSIYYLPLKEAVAEKEPAVYAIAVDQGRVLARTLSPRRQAPGNLILSGDRAFSQTATEVRAFPRQKDQEPRK